MQTVTQSIANAASVVSPVVSSAPAPVIPLHSVSDDVWQTYCDAIRDGRPTGGILPHRLSAIALTPAQIEARNAARQDNKLMSRQQFRALRKLTGRKCFTADGVRTSKAGAVTLRYAPADDKRSKKAALKAIASFYAQA